MDSNNTYDHCLCVDLSFDIFYFPLYSPLTFTLNCDQAFHMFTIDKCCDVTTSCVLYNYCTPATLTINFYHLLTQLCVTLYCHVFPYYIRLRTCCCVKVTYFTDDQWKLYNCQSCGSVLLSISTIFWFVSIQNENM